MRKIAKILLPAIILLTGLNVAAREVNGVSLDEQHTLAGQQLQLNGAGIRTKFVFDIYVGALYLPTKTTDAKQAIAMPGPKQVLMHILYDELSKEKLTDGWTAGFENNLKGKELEALKPRLAEFNQLFSSVKKGDQILLDYLPATGTQVTINKQPKGSVPGEDFNQALLKVWLGDEPADSDLKAAMLRVK